MRIQYLVVQGCGLALLLTAHSALADWVAHADFSSCPRKYYPNTSGQEGGFASESACQARVAQAKQGDKAYCIRYACKESGGGSSGGSASTGNILDDAYSRAMSASQNSNQMMQASGMYLGAKLLEGALQGPTPEQQAAAAAQRQYEAQLAAQQAIEAERRKNELLSEMQDIEEGGGELQLMTGDDDGSGGGLALMDDDGDTRGIMGKRKTPKSKRNSPPAVRKNPGPYTTPQRDANNGQLAMNFGDDEPQRAPRPVPAPDPAQAPEPESFNRGLLDGQACNQRSAGALCGGLVGEAAGRCLRNYNTGYDRGALENERRLTVRGEAQGRRDRGGNNAALSYPDARGSCGNIFIRAYNNAFR